MPGSAGRPADARDVCPASWKAGDWEPGGREACAAAASAAREPGLRRGRGGAGSWEVKAEKSPWFGSPCVAPAPAGLRRGRGGAGSSVAAVGVAAPEPVPGRPGEDAAAGLRRGKGRAGSSMAAVGVAASCTAADGVAGSESVLCPAWEDGTGSRPG